MRTAEGGVYLKKLVSLKGEREINKRRKRMNVLHISQISRGEGRN